MVMEFTVLARMESRRIVLSKKDNLGMYYFKMVEIYYGDLLKYLKLTCSLNRYVATDIPSDLLVQIEDVTFHLHKVIDSL